MMELPTTWQDWVLTAGQLVLFLALLPSVFSAAKPHLASSAMTSVVLYTFTVAFWSLGLVWGASMSALVASTWLILFLQRLVAGR